MKMPVALLHEEIIINKNKQEKKKRGMSRNMPVALLHEEKINKKKNK